MVKRKVDILWLSLSEILFQLLVFLLPTQLGYHFWPKWSFVYGVRIDYLSPTLYLTDLVLFFLFFGWLMSKPKLKVFNNRVLLFSFFLVALNISSAQKQALAFYKWLKIGELFFLFLYVYENKKKVLLRIRKPLFLAIVYTFFISILQMLFQRSLGGVFYFLGERTFSSVTPGISLVRIFGKDFLKPYSTFPHPNVMAGFSLASAFIFSGVSFLFPLFLVFISFSQNTWLVAILLSALFVLFRRVINKRFLVFVITFLFLGSLVLPLLSFRFLYGVEFVLTQSLRRRAELAVVSGKMFSKNPFLGVGLGNFVFELPNIFVEIQKQFDYKFEWWLQPVHNIYLLVLSETGIVGFLGFCYLIWKAMSNLIKIKKISLLMSLLSILLTGFNDHYWLTLQQGELLFAIVLGLSYPKGVE